MQKEFIPYTESLALKELGFDEGCFTAYWKDGDLYTDQIEGDFDDPLLNSEHCGEDEPWICTAPLYQQVFRWFREKHNIEGDVHYLTGRFRWCFQIKDVLNFMVHKVKAKFGSFEEAELECIREMIKTVQQRIN